MNELIMLNTNLSTFHVFPELKKIFLNKNFSGIVLLIHSPGGNPVQASIIYDTIIVLKKYHKKVVVIGKNELNEEI